MKNKKPTLLLDTCVVSDFINVDAEIIHLASKFLGRLHIPNVLMDELSKKFSLDVLDALELFVIDVPETLVDEAVLFRSKEGMSRLSVNDSVCFLTALRNKYTCVTNDKRLRRTCENNNVEVWWGLEMVLALYEQDGISYERAENFVIHLREQASYVKKEHEDEFRERLLNIRQSKEF